MSAFRFPSPSSSSQSSDTHHEFLDSSSSPLIDSYQMDSSFDKNTQENDQSSKSPVSLTQDQLNQLLSLITVQESPRINEPKTPPQQLKKEASRWPQWDGTSEAYDLYIAQLSTKIESDWEFLGGHKSVCNEMINTLPKDRKLRVSQWFSCGGPNKNWDYQLFMQHYNNNFQDKTSARAAHRTLSNMKQGEHQTFANFLNDYEYTLARARGLNWEDSLKINFLYTGLNKRLTKALFSKEL